MNLRSLGTHVLGVAIVLASIAQAAPRQVQASSATHVAAEMTKGKLNPAQSKPGDQVTLRLKEDVRSNGRVVLKKGTTITGVVKNVKRLEGKGETRGQAQSMMEIEWLAPVGEGSATQNLSIALQSVTQVSPLYADGQNAQFSDDFGLAATGAASGATAASPRSRAGAGSGGLLGGAVVGATTDVAVGAVSSTRTSGQSNAALLSMPTVVAADQQTSSAIDGSLGSAASGKLFKTGRGELVTAGGSRQSVEFFSHLNNDTVITSQNKTFEISSGAQMQLLVGMNNK
jgi:hypothetical protein